jgi:hypothetical protein
MIPPVVAKPAIPHINPLFQVVVGFAENATYRVIGSVAFPSVSTRRREVDALR